MDYKKLGLKMGLEIHQQLNTSKKLFSPCKCNLLDKKPENRILRKLRPTQSELGKIDRAAYEESRRKLQFLYESYDHETSLVEADEEPPHPLNTDALKISLIIASLLNMKVVDEFHTMRKQVIDGSNTGGFQRTGLVATDGYLDTEYGKVIIENLCLEEDAARRIGEKKGTNIFRLDRLGIPLVEITTDPSINHPEQVKDVAYQLGQILRSTRVKRGLGTIRQDLNISIREGARVEIKGVQDLDLMPTMVENEVKRQINLLQIKEKLQMRNPAVYDELYDVSEIFQDSESKIIKGALSKSGVVLAIKLNGFNGLIGREIQPGRRLGTELAGYAKKMGVSGIFHTDELPSYGITMEEVQKVRGFISADEDDALILVADQEEKARNALTEVRRRAEIAIYQVPEETRKALDDGNTEYLRPLPTASRMYVETDIPTNTIPRKYLEEIRSNLPELPEAKKERIMETYQLTDDIATRLVKEEKVEDFEEIMKEVEDIKPVIPASNLAYTFKELKREGCSMEKVDVPVLVEIYSLVAEGSIPAEVTPTIIRDACKDISPRESIEKHGLKKLSNDEVEEIIEKLISTNSQIIQERGMAAMGSLMGIAMKKLKGKADGKLVNQLVKEKLIRTIEQKN
ncbi:MAG TPA: Glu-tRNA(Gln) amidotransferase subunit GatE [Methanobacterium sp.]|nr:Glu-tRNA(Gln) amidotransferase subunit GatE [Methanobacterium sp.]